MIVQDHVRRGLPTLLFFRDAAKAFDIVWGDGLFDRLWDTAVRGKMWCIIGNLYKGTRSCVLVNRQRS